VIQTKIANGLIKSNIIYTYSGADLGYEAILTQGLHFSSSLERN
jgi:hypothetical protein